LLSSGLPKHETLRSVLDFKQATSNLKSNSNYFLFQLKTVERNNLAPVEFEQGPISNKVKLKVIKSKGKY